MHNFTNSITFLCDFTGVCDTCDTWMMHEPSKMHMIGMFAVECWVSWCSAPQK